MMLRKLFILSILLYFIVACSNNNYIKEDTTDGEGEITNNDSDEDSDSCKYLSLDMEELYNTKILIKQGVSSATDYLNEIKSNANSALNATPYSVTYKEVVPPSGDKHDYISMAPYWWPNPDTPDGLPYIRKDGQVNPESRTDYIDQKGFSNLCNYIYNLGLAYYFTEDDKYVICARKMISVFFIYTDTRMNPNLKYGQFVPGVNEGRPAGIIETVGLRSLLEGVALFSDSEIWTDEINSQLQSWMNEYLEWLQTNTIGIEECESANNHGTHYDEQCIAMMLFSDDIEKAITYINTYTLKRLDSQTEFDGSQPNELSRTKSWSYTNMNLDGFVKIALMTEKIDIDLWHYQKNGQTYIKSMIDWFIPYLKKEKSWKWKQIHTDYITRIQPVLEIAADRYNDDSYLELIKNFQTIHENIVFE